MLSNHIKLAIRTLLRQKGISAINMLGLSIGLACFSLFLLYAVNELGYDRFHTDADRIFRVYRWIESKDGRETEGDPYMPMPLGQALKDDLPEIEEFVRWRDAWGENFVRVNHAVSRMGIQLADPQVFEVFDFPLKYGNAKTALTNLNDVVLTEKVALQLFGEPNPVGRTLEIKVDDAFEPFTVTAVAEDLPANSSLRFGILGNFQKLPTTRHGARRKDSWNHSAYMTYVRLRPGSQLPDNSRSLLDFRKKYYPEEAAEEKALREKGEWTKATPPVSYRLQPLEHMHNDARVLGGEVPVVEPKKVWILLAIATGVLLIACINFTTLAIGRSAGRAREVGVRKVMGSDRRRLIGQFLAEALVLTALSVAIGLALVQLLMPYFNQLADRELVFSLNTYPEMGWMLAGLTLLVGLLAGSYPAFVLSGFNPVEVLKSKVRLGGSNVFTRSLVAGQFVISIGLIVSALIVLRQLDFMRTQHPGFDKENVVVVDADEADTKSIFPKFRQAALAIPQVKGLAAAEVGLGEGAGWSRSEWDDNGTHREVFEYYVDPGFLPVMGLQLIAGRNFDPAVTADSSTSVIINETMANTFGWTAETALGQALTGYYQNPESPLPRVIGVVRDFHYRPFRETVKPQLFHYFGNYAPYKFFVRIEAGSAVAALAGLKKSWQAAEPSLPFQYSFLDEDLDRFYKSEARLSGIISWAGGISVFLACLGLLGLAALAASNRTKEIGIRKILGASVASLAGLLSKDFLKLVLLAFVIASPIAWYFMENWLEDFAYRIEIAWWMFALAGAAAVVVAFATVSVQGIRAALANPVNSLRSE